MLIIFDLDDTLIHEGFRQPRLCNDTIWILEFLKKNGHRLAIASHNTNAKIILKKCQIDHYFDIIVGECPTDLTKITLINKILEHCRVNNKEQVIFFDDIETHIHEISSFKIKSHLVNWINGITKTDIVNVGLI